MPKPTWLAVSHFYTLNCPKLNIELPLSKCRLCEHWRSGTKDGVECDYEPNKPKPKGDPMSTKDSIAALEHDAGEFARKLNELRGMAYRINKIADELNFTLRTFCIFIDDLKKAKE